MTNRIFVTPGMNPADLIEAYKIIGYEQVIYDGEYLLLDWKKPKVTKPKNTDEKDDKKKPPQRRTKNENRLRGKNNGV